MTQRSRALPAGSWPVSALYPHVLLAGSALHCSACGRSGKAPNPGAHGYGAVIEAFLSQHKRCACPGEARP